MAREERDYSHRTLADKLGVKPGARICVRGSFDEGFVTMLAGASERAPSRAVRGRYDLIFLFVGKTADLHAISALAKALEPAGGLWIVHPKGKGASPSDAQVRAAGLAADLVDNKISAFSETHTATRYVIPKAKR